MNTCERNVHYNLTYLEQKFEIENRNQQINVLTDDDG